MQGSSEDAGVKVEDGFVRLTIVGECSLAEAADRIDAAIAYALKIGTPKLLADVRSAHGTVTPSLVDRYYLIQRWADTAAHSVRLAVIALPEMIDPERIGVTIARNRSFDADVFEDESPALEWLLE